MPEKFDLQLFAEEEGEEEVEFEDLEAQGGETDEGAVDDEGGSEAGEVTFDEDTQRQLEQKINQMTARERTRFEKKLKRIFGTTDLEKAGEFYRAGFAVSQASGRPPGEVVQRVTNPQQQQGAPQQGYPDDTLRREIEDIKGLLSDKFEEEEKSVQEKEARQEFGSLYDEHKEDVEDTAEERGLSLTDAAAIVLRPHLKTFYEKRTQQSKKRRRRVEGSNEAPPKGEVDVSSKLTPEMKRIAAGMGLSQKEYYEHAKATGLISDE